MTPEIEDAIDSARTVGKEGVSQYAKWDAKCHPKNTVVAILKSVARDLPPEMTMGELLEELGG